jgi:hypothetical protein
LISIGIGHLGLISLPECHGFEKMIPISLIHTLKEITTNAEFVAGELSDQYRDLSDTYFIFNACGVRQFALEECKKMRQVRELTEIYLQDDHVSRVVDSVVMGLCGSPMNNQVTWWSGPLLHMACTYILFQLLNRRTCT